MAKVLCFAKHLISNNFLLTFCFNLFPEKMKLSRSWIGLMLVCLVTANSVLAEEEEEDATTTESNPELSETNSTEVLLNGSANATDLIEVNGNSTQLGRELTNPSLGETFKMIGVRSDEYFLQTDSQSNYTN